MRNAPFSNADLMEVVERSLDNELCLDRYLKSRHKLQNYENLPNFKVIKLANIMKKMGPLWKVTLFCLPAVVIGKLIFQWILAFLFSFSTITCKSQVFILSTSTANNQRIKKCLGTEYDDDDAFLLGNFQYLARSQRTIEISKLVVENLTSLSRLLVGSQRDIFSRIMHFNNSFEMLLMAKFVSSNPQYAYVTDDHYQRWSFVLSHVASRLKIIQHGYLDSANDIQFNHDFGRTDTIFLWRAEDKDKFSCFLQCNEYLSVPLDLDLVKSKLGENCIFLASSSPFLDAEIKFLAALRQVCDLKVLVKLHPLHSYGKNVNELLKQADEIWSGDEFPKCRIFVSYNSALGEAYAASGCSVLKLIDFKSATEASEEVVRQTLL